jgi:hypothetical protein
MQENLVALLVVISSAVAFAGQDSAEWIKYVSPQGHYSIVVPKEPTLSTQEASGATGEKFSQYIATAADSSATYMIGYFDYTPAMSFSLEKGRDGMVAAVKGTLLSENSISLGGSPGLELKVSAKGEDGVEYIVHARFYDVNKRVYFVQFIIPKPDDTTTAAEKMAKYFDSFKVVKTP